MELHGAGSSIEAQQLPPGTVRFGRAQRTYVCLGQGQRQGKDRGPS